MKRNVLPLLAVMSICVLYAQDPCTMHDNTQYHGLHATQANPDCPCEPSEPCTYDHEHGDDPSEIAAFGGTFPPIPDGPEVHALWKYHVRTDIAPQGEGNLYVRNLIALVHIGGVNKAMEVRFHGTHIWAEICSKETGQCGIFKQRIFTDFGCLQVETDAGLIDSPFGLCPAEGGGGRRLHFRRASAPWLNGRFTWYGNQGIFAGNQMLAAVGSAISGNDAWSGRDPADWNLWLWNCPELSYCTGDGCQPDPSTVDVSACNYNDSSRGIEALNFTIGVSDASGFTDFSGNVDPSCLSESVSCFPFSLEGVPTGFAAYRPADSVEYDDFTGLIGFPN